MASIIHKGWGKYAIVILNLIKNPYNYNKQKIYDNIIYTQNKN